jgi:phosphohistidine phosphatase SixA
MYKFKLILLRHGEPNKGENAGLSSMGTMQLRGLSKEIKKELGKSEVTIWTSSAKRAEQSAQTIKSELQLTREIKEFDKLWSDSKNKEDFKWLKDELDNFTGKGTLIICSHLEYVRNFPEYLGYKKNEAYPGQGVVIQDEVCREIKYGSLAGLNY